MIKLVVPTIELKAEALVYRQEHFDKGEKIINGSELFDKTENLIDFGHCGYSVRPSQRNKGYVTEMLRQITDVARKAGLYNNFTYVPNL